MPQPDRLTYVVDVCLGKNLVSVLQEQGVDAKFLPDCGFSPDAPEEEWMPAVAAKGLVALSHDSNVRRRETQQTAIRRSKLRLFLLQTKKVNKETIVEVFTQHWQRIEQIARETPGPFIMSVSRGEVKPLGMHHARKSGH